MPVPLWAGPTASVREGTEAFRTGDYAQAVRRFAEAEKERSDDERIVYNLGVAQAAAGKWSDAVETLRKSAVSKDKTIACRSLALLGDIMVRQAKQLLDEKSVSDEKPDESQPDRRREVLDRLNLAEKYFAEWSSLDPSDRTASENIEQLRAAKNRIIEDWDLADRLKNRGEKLPERIGRLENWERTLRAGIRQRIDEPDSPKKFQQFYEAAKDQRRLGEELKPLHETIRRTLAEQDSKDPQNATGTERTRQTAYDSFFGEISDSVRKAETALAEGHSENALNESTVLVENFDQMRNNLLPFEQIVSESVQKQELLRRVNPVENVQKSEGPTIVEAPKTIPEEQSLRNDSVEQAWEQELVARRIPYMIARAKQGLQTTQTPEDNSNVIPPRESSVKKSLELAVQYGPEIQTLTEDAAKLLLDKKVEDAGPKQQRALELLKEILKEQQKEQQQNQQQNQQQQQNDQQKKEQQENQQQNGQQQNKDRQDGNENKKEEQKQDQPERQDKKEGQRQDERKQEKENGAKDGDARQESRSEKELTPQEKKRELEKAEQMLRQVRRRQQEVEEKRERVRVLLRQSEPVEKDW